ncbi:MAG: hypothetical protein WD844_03375 [Thermoleophilaceae bacterium]
MSAVEERIEPRPRHVAEFLDILDEPSPASDVREMLKLYRTRGYPFEQAWSRALRTLPQRVVGIDEWHFQLRRTKPAWRAAYERRNRLVDQRA